ncbi:MAG TPA: DNA-3-methyladenine glycosylase [Candidatus Polarisedimenticolaceae bacterium]|nr:DNA-3-methyladenine glycosylase [Candidatus Polarisedimenticolaceae bacterium]
MLESTFYNQDSLTAAQALLGCELIYIPAGGEPVGGRIAETEAYRQDDEASHSYRGLTKRNAVMFGAGGHAYVYFTYGVHYCFNVVVGEAGFAEAVLIRALEPTHGVKQMELNRGTSEQWQLCSGPGKLVQALGLGRQHNGASLLTPELQIRERTVQPRVIAGPRIGISRAADKPWRFMIADSPWVTRHKFNKQAQAVA